MRATNGPAPEGMRLELITGLRCETPHLSEASQYTGGYVAPFQCIKLGTASRGFRSGSCLVLFPDLITVRLVQKNQTRFWREIVEFVLLDRMFRYPMDAAHHLTFDGGTGILLFEILIKSGALYRDELDHLRFDTERLVPQLEAIIAEIEALEELDDDAYNSAAQAYVQRHLGRPTAANARFDFPNTQYARRVVARRAA